MTNPYCAALGIPVPRMEDAKSSPDANYYSLLLVALLERGGPLTLSEAASRFEEAGIAPARDALASLKRCKPGRAPIYRDGEHYALDPHDDEADLWAFRLGLRPPRTQPLRLVQPDPGPLPSPDERLTVPELDGTGSSSCGDGLTSAPTRPPSPRTSGASKRIARRTRGRSRRCGG